MDRKFNFGSEIALDMDISTISGSPVLDKVYIIQNKEIKTIIDTIINMSGSVNEVILDTSTCELEPGTVIDRWSFDNGEFYEQEFTLIDTNITPKSIKKTKSEYFYSKDVSLLYNKNNGGDILRVYNERSIAQKILSVLKTVKGSLINEPNYGCDLYKKLFMVSNITKEELASTVWNAINNQISEVELKGIDIDDKGNGTYLISTQVYIKSHPTKDKTFTVNTEFSK